MATTFLDLPDELILQVAELLFSRDRCNLRLVTKRMDHLISPKLFETLRFLGPFRSSPQNCASLSEYIGLGMELVFSRFTKAVDIRASGLHRLDRHFPWLRLLTILVPTLTNLHSLKWSYWPTNPSILPLVVEVLDCFGSMSSLRELMIEVAISEPFPEFTLQSFSNHSLVSVYWNHGGNINQNFICGVADLLGRCPNLEKFTFSVPRPYHPLEVPSFTHVFTGIGSLPSTTCLKLRELNVTGLRVSADDFRVHLRHLHSLKILRLMFNRHADSPEQNDQICRLLLDNSIYLDELVIDTTHPPSVLEYLSSYSGLEHLEFRSRYPGADSPESVHRFFSVVLPLHIATLRVLHLGWSVETPWTRDITPVDLAQIEKCQQLRRLSCYVTMTIGPTGRTDRLLRTWLETAMKLARLQHLWFYPTCLSQPRPHAGHFYYDQDTVHEYDMETEVKKFSLERVEKLTAGHIVPFEIRVLSPTLGP